MRLHFILDNFSPHLGDEVRSWAADNNVELAYTPHYGSWLNRIEAQFKALRYFTLDGIDHPDHATQARLIRRYIAWRNYNADEPALRQALPVTIEVELGGGSLAAIHDAGPARGRLARLRRRFPDADAVVFGHSHLPSTKGRRLSDRPGLRARLALRTRLRVHQRAGGLSASADSESS